MHVTIRSWCPDSPIYREPVFSAKYNRVLLQFRIQAFNETANFVGSAPAFILTKTSTKERTGAYTVGFNKVVSGGVLVLHKAINS